ncbi:MAG: SRPBCC family protein [Sphingomonas sp.]
MKRTTWTTALATSGIAAAAAGLSLAWARRTRATPDDAPGRSARRGRFGDYAVTGTTVTITKPTRSELFAFWRDFTNLPAFMDNLDKVEKRGSGWRWTIRAPAGDAVAVDTEIAEERVDELIAWRATAESEIATEGRVRFKDAPGGRGTEVTLIVAYKPPFGRVGQGIAKLLQREPAIQARRDLRRFRMLMETGEIATSDRRRPTEENA